ncbi:MAG: hypothetical protein R3E65_02790 [Steroidobacteraceae bacterium]
MSESRATADDRIGALPPARRRAVQVLGALVWLTGAVWLIFKYFVRVPDEFGFDNPHPQMGSWMIAHAFASLGAVWLMGVLWRGHVVRGWNLRQRRGSGGTLFGLAVWLALSGCTLYYIGSDVLRDWVSLAHWVPGLVALGVFLVHRPR